MLHLAADQIRLLLCTPDRKRELRDGEIRLDWSCGCTAVEEGFHKYFVMPCAYHGPLLQHVRRA